MSGRSQHPPALSEDLHRNRGLFSDHYLDETIPGHPGWAALSGETEAVMGAEAVGLGRRLSELVNTAYSLTPEEVDFLWSTAPDARVLEWMSPGVFPTPHKSTWSTTSSPTP
jgi:hypothetical protein